MYCNKCGAPVKEGAKFCGNCGVLLSENSINDMNNTNNFNKEDNLNKNNNQDNFNNSNKLNNFNSLSDMNNLNKEDNLNKNGNQDNFNNGYNQNINETNFGVSSSLGNKQTNSLPINKNIIISIGGVVAVVLVVLALIFVVGGNKKLLCTGQESGMDVLYEFNFKRKKIDNFKAKLTMTVSSSQMDAVIDSFESMMEDYKKDGMNLNYKKDDDKLTVILSGDVETVGKAIGVTTYTSETYDEVKEEMESFGDYTCK